MMVEDFGLRTILSRTARKQSRYLSSMRDIVRKRKALTTCLVDNINRDNYGSALLFESSSTDVLSAAYNLSEIEGFFKFNGTCDTASLTSSWGCIGLLMNPNVTNTELVDKWINIFNETRHESFNHKEYPWLSENGFVAFHEDTMNEIFENTDYDCILTCCVKNNINESMDKKLNLFSSMMYMLMNSQYGIVTNNSRQLSSKLVGRDNARIREDFRLSELL